MDVRLLTTITQLLEMQHNAAYAMLTCHANTEKLQHEAPRSFIEKAIKAGHESILEHITLTYEVNNLSRACLQELRTHRHASFSVESTRHTLKKKFFDDDFFINASVSMPETYWGRFVRTIDYLRELNSEFKLTNDELKYYIPELWPTNLVMTANIRELRHIVKLRTSPAALQEFQDLARKFVEVLHDDFKYLLEDCVHE